MNRTSAVAVMMFGIALIVAIVLLLPALGMLIGGAAGSIAYATARNDDGYFDVSLSGLQTRSAAVVSDDIDLGSELNLTRTRYVGADRSLGEVAISVSTTAFSGISPLCPRTKRYSRLLGLSRCCASSCAITL